MFVRYLLVLAGALVITSGLLYFMQSVAIRMTGGANTLYYLVNDFIPAPDRGRQRPVAPPAPETTPARPTVSIEDELPGRSTVTEPMGSAAAEHGELWIEPVRPLDAADQPPAAVLPE